MRSRLIEALNNRFYVKFMQLEIGLFLKKICMLPTLEKWTFYKGLYGENDGPTIWGKRRKKHIFKL